MITARAAVIFLFVFLTPGSLIMIFARRMVEYNSRSYPRVYGRVGRIVGLIGFYALGLVWLVGGIIYLTDR